MSQPQDTAPHRRRKPRKAPADPDIDGAARTDDGTIKSKQKPVHKKRNSPPQHESALTQELQEASGMTTPPRSSHGRNANEGDQLNHNGQKNMRKKKNQQVTTPGPKQQRHATPHKGQFETAYAGPTFNSSSPAPANLPIPKMFSKSAPPADQEVGIKARLQREESGHSSTGDEAPDSPSTRPSTGRVAGGGPAMFDFLINAHRKEQAGQMNQTLSPPQAGTRENSISPVHSQSLHRPKHSRTLTDGQLFPLEPSNSNVQHSPSPAQSRQLPLHQLGPAFNNSPQSQPTGDGNLKRMLFSSPQQAPSNGYYSAPAPSQWNSSPVSQASHSPYASPMTASSGLASSSRPAPVSPYTQASPSPSARRTGYPPYNNSGLRREFSPEALNHTPPPLGNLPRYQGNSTGSPLASPTYQRFHHNHSPFGGQGFGSPDRNASPAGNKRFSAQDALKSLGTAPQMSEMEDRLRQILKIDSMGPAGSQSSNSAGAIRS